MKFRTLMLAFLTLTLVMAGLVIYVRSQAVSPAYFGLNGKITNSDGSLFNGRLVIELARPSAMNLCTSPVRIVYRQPATFPIANGAITGGTSAQFVTNTCLTPSVPYFAQIFDSNNNLVYSDNWFFPRINSSNIDVGTLMDVAMPEGNGFGGTSTTSTPITVAIPAAIVASPSGAQTITQPGATSLTINNLAVTGTFTSTSAINANITGNAATATALAALPINCATGFYARGINTFGNANCSNSFPTNSSFQTLTITGATISYAAASSFINKNLTGSAFETDFINNSSTGGGGWYFYDASNTSTPAWKADKLGNVTATSFIGPLTGNASTATALAATPSQCTGSQVSTGIDASGNAHCSASASYAQTNCLVSSCVGGSTYSTSTTYTNSSAFPVMEEVGMVNNVDGLGCVGSESRIIGYVNSATVASNGYDNFCGDIYGKSVSFIVPPGQTFYVTVAKISGGGSGPWIVGWWYEVVL